MQLPEKRFKFDYSQLQKDISMSAMTPIVTYFCGLGFIFDRFNSLVLGLTILFSHLDGSMFD